MFDIANEIFEKDGCHIGCHQVLNYANYENNETM